MSTNNIHTAENYNHVTVRELTGEEILILHAHKEWLAGEETGKRADLSGADLHNTYWGEWVDANLTGANLHKANLSRVSLCNANLSEVDLSGADLHESILVGTDLSGADLTGADLSEVRNMA